MTTIAKEWQDYSASCYPGIAPERIGEQRMSFYAGWHACTVALGHMKTDTAAERAAAIVTVESWDAEFEAEVRRYVQDRRARMQREE